MSTDIENTFEDSYFELTGPQAKMINAVFDVEEKHEGKFRTEIRQHKRTGGTSITAHGKEVFVFLHMSPYEIRHITTDVKIGIAETICLDQLNQSIKSTLQQWDEEAGYIGKPMIQPLPDASVARHNLLRLTREARIALEKANVL